MKGYASKTIQRVLGKYYKSSEKESKSELTYTRFLFLLQI